MKRRLSAILAADVVGYSRLMGANEVGTLSALNDLRRELVDGAISGHDGRIVKLTGDGILAEFPSVVSALECAMRIQQEMPLRNADVPDDRRIHFRIGINVGDVIIENDDIFGEGVNIAARIEALARPGGIAVSGAVHDQIGTKLDVAFEAAGDQMLKNIALAVPVFHVAMPTSTPHARKEPAAPPVRPSIAVLPFVNMSGDPEQEYFADGITEDIITDLSKISGLFVVGRNSVFVYKGKAVKLQDAAKDLGVRYILEGSVRKAGQRVRITGQLIDGLTGGHIWADRYDRDLTDVFAVQDEIAKTIIDQLQVRLLAVESVAIEKTPTRNVEAYSYYLKGRQLYHMRTSKYVQLGRRMFLKAVEHDPNYGRAYAGISDCDSWLSTWFGQRNPTENTLQMADRAVELEPDLAEAHAARGFALQGAARYDEAKAEYDRALAIDPSCYEAHHYVGRLYHTKGEFDQSAYHFTRALEIRPDDYRSPLLLVTIYNSQGNTVERDKYLQLGLKRAEDSVAAHRDHSDPLELGAAALAASGYPDQARDWLERAFVIDPELRTRPHYNTVCTYAQLGDVEKAIDLLEIVVREISEEAREWFKTDPDIDPLRDHPRYIALMGRPLPGGS
jgi:adenylate cyclase